METHKHKSKRRDSFWRACRYMRPHLRLAIIASLAALVVGATFTGGLGTMLPIMQVLINGETIPDWGNRKIAENRLGMRFADDTYELRVARVDDGSPGARAGVQAGQVLYLPNADGSRQPIARLLGDLADPGRSAVGLQAYSPAEGPQRPHAVDLPLPRMPQHMVIARRAVSMLPTHPIKAIAAVLGFLMFLAVFGNIVRFFQEYLSEKAAILTVRDIRRHFYDHTLHLYLSFFGQRGTSDVTSRLTQDAQGLQDGMKVLMGSSVQESIKAAMALGLALYISWPLTLFIIFFAPLMFTIIRKFGKKVRRAAKAALQNSSALLGQVESSLSGIRVVKGNNAERFERRRFRGIMATLVHEQLRIARLEAFNTPMLEILTLVVVCAIVLYASYLVLVVQTVPRSTFFLVMACLMGIGESLRKVSKINTVLQKSNAAAARLFEIMDLPIERPRLRGPANGAQSTYDGQPRIAIPPVQREIAFEGITFTYPGATAPALCEVDLTVKRGQCVAVVGRNGSGKTTLLALLPRFFDPERGRIAIDGVDVRIATLTSLRRQIGIVTQDSVIFPGTIAQNIAYAMPLAKRDDIIAAAQRAFAHEFVLEKPQGYDTVLGEHGAQLSGGQKQRLCIARAILRQTPILILDEATSQVDAESEHLIQQAIEGLIHERTTFVIAHRFSTILAADRIVVMDRGRIVGSGTHDALLETCETYRQLYERQLGK